MPDFTIKKEKHINCIINEFDFSAVHKVMKSLNWEWYTDNGFSIPSIEQLKDSARALLENIYDCDEYDIISVSSGGFKACIFDDHLALEFVVTEYSSEDLNFGPSYEKIKNNKSRKNKLNIIQKLNKNGNS